MTCDCGECVFIWTGGVHMACMACGKRYPVIVTLVEPQEQPDVKLGSIVLARATNQWWETA